MLNNKQGAFLISTVPPLQALSFPMLEKCGVIVNDSMFFPSLSKMALSLLRRSKGVRRDDDLQSTSLAVR